jgi:hypothetical protein
MLHKATVIALGPVVNARTLARFLTQNMDYELLAKWSAEQDATFVYTSELAQSISTFVNSLWPTERL